MPQIFDVTANENARYKRNELEWQLFADFFRLNVNKVHLNNGSTSKSKA